MAGKFSPHQNVIFGKNTENDLNYEFVDALDKKNKKETLTRCNGKTQMCKNYVLPRDSVKSFPGPYLLLENTIVDKKNYKYKIEIDDAKCYPDYVFTNSRIWDLKVPGGLGLFQTNLKTMEFGPKDNTKTIYMCKKNVNDATLDFEGITFGDHTKHLQKKNEDLVLEIFKSKSVLKPIVHFLTARDAIPFRSTLHVKKIVDFKEQKFEINVAKYNYDEAYVEKNNKKLEDTSNMYLKIGAVTKDTPYFKSYSLASSCLNLVFNINTKIMKIDYLQTKPSFGLDVEFGYLGNYNDKLKCVTNVTEPEENKKNYAFTYKDWLEISLQLTIHIGSAFAIEIEDYMNVMIAGKQKLSLARLGLGTEGTTKYGELLQNLNPTFKFYYEKKFCFMHPFAYKLYCVTLPQKILDETLEPKAATLKQYIFEFLNVNKDQQKKIRKVKHLVNFLVKIEDPEALLNNFKINKKSFKFLWQKKNDKSVFFIEDFFISNLIWYFIKSDRRENLGFSAATLNTLRDKIQENLILNNRNNEVEFQGDLIIEQSLKAMKIFDPYASSFYTNNFQNKISDLEIVLWK